MSATDELRRLLDGRGIEYFKHEDGEPLRKLEKADEPATSWHMGDASVCSVPIEGSDLFDLWIDHLTPEQAVEATLGRGTCRDLAETPEYRDKTEFKCSECGYEYSAVGGFGCDCGDEPDFRYCPNCGAKVVDA